jgi:hypothetical protein
MIELGDRVKDRLTGFEGIAIAITEWLYNCRRITVQPTDLDKDGAVAKAESFDEDQVEIVAKGALVAKVPRSAERVPAATFEVVEEAPAPQPVAAKTGGPRNAPSRRSDPTR